MSTGFTTSRPARDTMRGSCRWSLASHRTSKPWQALPAPNLHTPGCDHHVRAGSGGDLAGTHMVIASGRVQHPLEKIGKGAACTWFLTPANPVTSRKKWIAGSLEPRGALII